jgi:hypothetical protein
MQALIRIVLVVLPFVGESSAQASSAAPGTIRSEVSTKGTNGEPAVMTAVLTIIREPISKETELCAKGAFAVDSLIPGTCQIEANSSLYAALAVTVSADTPSTIPVEERVSPLIRPTSPELPRLKAKDCAFSRNEHHA